MDQDQKKQLAKRKDISLRVKGSLLYGDSFVSRALVMAIPFVGGSIDMILKGAGAEYQQKRIELYLELLDRKLNEFDEASRIEIDDEELFDLVSGSFDEVVKTKSREKINRFANLSKNYIMNELEWDEVEAALRLASDLSESHVAILLFVVNDVPHNKGFFLKKKETQKVFDDKIPVLNDAFQNYSVVALQLFCSELLSRGLLSDIGVGRHLDVGAMEYLNVTQLGKWFIDVVSD